MPGLTPTPLPQDHHENVFCSQQLFLLSPQSGTHIPLLHVPLVIHLLSLYNNVIKPRFYPRLCQFLIKIRPVINWVCACVKTSVQDDNLLSMGGLGMCEPNDFYLTWEFLRFALTERIVPGNFGFAISVCKLRERGRMSNSVYVRVFHDLELLRYILRCALISRWDK